MSITSDPKQQIIYSVIIPAYNEEDFLPETLSSLVVSMDKTEYVGEIIVVDNNSTDNTSLIAKEYGANVIFEPVNQFSRAKNVGARAAKGSFLIFMDADSSISGNLLRQVLLNLNKGLCCGGGALVSFDINRPFACLIQNFFNILAKKQQIAPGSFIFCRREAFDEIGGFNEKLYATEDIQFSKKLKE